MTSKLYILYIKYFKLYQFFNKINIVVCSTNMFFDKNVRENIIVPYGLIYIYYAFVCIFRNEGLIHFSYI